MKIAITGATGQLGQLVIQHLVQKIPAEQIVALVRDLNKAQNLKDQGIELRHFDYDQPDTLAAALNGVDKLLLISANEIGRRAPQHKAVIEAAQQANVPYIAYTSLLHADDSPLGLAQEHRETEQMIRDSGLRYTFLRNNWYAENYLGNLAHDVQSGVIYGAADQGEIHAASRNDYAEAAAEVLLGRQHFGKTYELASTVSFTKSDLAAVISKVSGQPVRYENLSPEDYRNGLIKAGLDADFAAFLADVDFKTSHGAMETHHRALEALIHRPTTALEEIVSQHLNMH